VRKKSSKSVLLGSTATPPSPPPQRPHAEVPRTAIAGPPIAATPASRPRERHAPYRRDSNGERGNDGEDSDEASAPRNRHGDRTVPPPPTFSLSDLPDDGLLTERDVAAIGRWAVITVNGWRYQRRPHGLKWITIPGGQIRYLVRDLRAYLASGAPRAPKPKFQPENSSNPPSATKPKAARRSSRRRAGDQPSGHHRAGDQPSDQPEAASVP